VRMVIQLGCSTDPWRWNAALGFRALRHYRSAL
jgi:hypothetical protein